MSKPFFSIVFPTYGVESYIAEAIEDIQAQTFKDWELIVVDDCTQDKSITIAEKYAEADQRIRIVHHEVNQGLSCARNTGIAEASGSYLWIPDPDDRYDCSLLKNIHNALINHPAPLTIIGHTDDFYDNENKVSNRQDYCLKDIAEKAIQADPANKLPVSNENKFSNYWNLTQEQFRKCVLDLEVNTHYGYAWNKVYQCEYLRSLGLAFETVPLIEDIVFNVAFAQNIESANFIDGMPYHYAKREKGNLTNKFIPKYFEVHQRRIEILCDQLKEWGLYTDETKAILGSLFARYILSALERNERKESGFSKQDKANWCNELFSNSLFNELIPFAEPQNSKALDVCIKAMKAKNAKQLLLLGKGIHFAKSSMSGLFNKEKSKR